ADLSLEQRLAPLPHVIGRSVLEQRLHVAGVRRRAVEYLRRPGDAAHDLAQRRVLEVGERAAVRFRPPQVPQTRFSSLRFQLVDQRNGLPAALAFHVLVPLVLVRVDVLVHEGDELLTQLLDLRRVVEAHAALLRIFSACCQPSCASGTVLLAASCACWLAAVPSSTRLAMPWQIAAMRNRL